VQEEVSKKARAVEDGVVDVDERAQARLTFAITDELRLAHSSLRGARKGDDRKGIERHCASRQKKNRNKTTRARKQIHARQISAVEYQ
jgi:hypothetical protein